MSSLNTKALIAISDQLVAAEVALVLAHRGISNPLMVSSIHDAIDAMVETDFHLFIVDAAVPMASDRPGVKGGVDFIRFIRMCEGAVSEAVVVFIRTEIGILDLLEVRDEIVCVEDAGVNSILVQPLTLKKFDEIIAPDLENPRPFLRDGSYTGPYSRRLTEFANTDRRKN